MPWRSGRNWSISTASLAAIRASSASFAKLRGKSVAPEARAVIDTAPGEEAQVDYGAGPMVRDPHTGKYRRTRLFVLTLGYSRKCVRLLSFQSSSRIWAELHEKAFRRLGGTPRVVVLDNLREGVLAPDIYDPALNPLYRDLLAHYGAVALPCRVRDPDRKGKVESGVGHAQEDTAERASASRAWRRRRRIWIAGKSAGPTRASTAPPSGRSRRCSPKRSPPCCRCRSSLSAITNTASARCIWMAAWKWRQLTTARRRAGSAAACACSGTAAMSGCSIRSTGQLLREHLRQQRGRHRINDEDRPNANTASARCSCWRAPNKTGTTSAHFCQHDACATRRDSRAPHPGRPVVP